MSEQKTDQTTVVKTDAELLKEVEMLKIKNGKLEGMLKQAIDIANKANAERAAKDEAEKADLITCIIIDSDKKFTAEQLQTKSLSDLRLIKTVLDTRKEATFASVAALQAEQDKKHAPYLTVGAWDAKKQEWIGGL